MAAAFVVLTGVAVQQRWLFVLLLPRQFCCYWFWNGPALWASGLRPQVQLGQVLFAYPLILLSFLFSCVLFFCFVLKKNKKTFNKLKWILLLKLYFDFFIDYKNVLLNEEKSKFVPMIIPCFQSLIITVCIQFRLWFQHPIYKQPALH